jgi:hypothetical protein
MIKKYEPTVLRDIAFYSENRSKFPPDELARFWGQYVAWSPDGTRILASGADPEAVENELVAAGINLSTVVLGYVDLPNEGFLG